MAAVFVVESCVRGYHLLSKHLGSGHWRSFDICSRGWQSTWSIRCRCSQGRWGRRPRGQKNLYPVLSASAKRWYYIMCGYGYSYHLPQGGMEIPCLLKFCSNNKLILQRTDINAVVSVKEPPTKIFKPSKSSSSAKPVFYPTGDPHVWVKCHRGVLSFNDKAILQNSGELSNKHSYSVCSKTNKLIYSNI